MDQQNKFDKFNFFFGFFVGIALTCVVVLALAGILYLKFGSVQTGDNQPQAVGEVQKDVEQNAKAVVDLAPKPVKNVAAAPPVSARDRIMGDSTAKVTLVEYSDFQCPYCKKFNPIVRRLMSEYKGKVRWVYRHFPLSFHAQSQKAAEASECAGDQGKFWEYGDKIFANQKSLSPSSFEQFSVDLGLNAGEFKTCLDSGKYAQKVRSDMQGGIAAGVKGTPATFINGELVGGAVPYEQLKAMVDSKL